MLRCAVLFLLLAPLVLAQDDSDVLELDADNFEDGIAGVPLMLVEFYAPWCAPLKINPFSTTSSLLFSPCLSLYRCGHCKKLAPEYEIAATALVDNNPPIPLAKVDCPANTGVCSQFGVSGYPTIKIFRNGIISGDYSGPRNAGIQTSLLPVEGLNLWLFVRACVCVCVCRWDCSVHEKTIWPQRTRSAGH